MAQTPHRTFDSGPRRSGRVSFAGTRSTGHEGAPLRRAELPTIMNRPLPEAQRARSRAAVQGGNMVLAVGVGLRLARVAQTHDSKHPPDVTCECERTIGQSE